MRISKKVLAVTMSALIGAAALAVVPGCSSKVPAAGKPESNGGTGGGKAITVWTYMESETPTLKKYADEWGKKTGNTVNVIWQKASMQQFSQAANSSKGPDVIYGIANNNVGTFATAGLVQEVPQGTIEDSDYNEASIQATYVNGKRYSVPISIETLGLYYNTDKIKSAPATWDELIESSKKVGLSYYMTDSYYCYGIIRSMGGYVFKYNDGKYDTNDIGLNNDGTIKALHLIGDLVTKYHFMNQDITEDIAKSNFQNGKVGLYIGGPWNIASFKKAGVKFGIVPLPTIEGKNIPAFVGTQVAFVSAKSKNQNESWDFIKYMLDNSAMDLFDVGARIPAKKSSQQDKKLLSDSFTQAFIKQASYGEALINVPEMDAYWAPVQNNVKLIIAGKSTPEKAASDIENQIKNGIKTQNNGK